MFSGDRPLVGHHLPGAIWTLRQIFNLCVGVKLGAIPARRLGIGMGDTIRVNMALDRVIHGPDKLGRVDQRQQFMRPLRCNDLQIIHAKIFALGIDALEPVKSLLGCGQHDTTCHMERDVLPGQLFNFLVKVDRILLQLGDIRVAIDGVHATGGVPGGPGCEFRALEHDNIRPAELREMIQH